MREGFLKVTSNLVNLTLAARDQIRDMLEELQNPLEAAQGAVRAAEIIENLKAFTLPVEPAPPTPTSVTGPVGILRRFRIRFRPFREILLQGANPLLLFRELGDMGVLQIETDVSGLPELSQMDPESSYLGWDLLLNTKCPVDAVRGVFIFFEDDCELRVEEDSLGQADSALAPQQCAGSALEGLPAELKREPWTLGSMDGRRDPHSVGGDKASLRVALERVDSLINFVGELVTVQARLSQLAARSDTSDLRIAAEDIERLIRAARKLDEHPHAAARGTFERFRRLVHDSASNSAKRWISIEGAEHGTGQDRDRSVERSAGASDPQQHGSRHRDAGSPPRGGQAPHRDASTFRPGILRRQRADPGERRRARSGCGGRRAPARSNKGLIDAGARLSEAEIFSLILAPGFLHGAARSPKCPGGAWAWT